MLMLLKPKPEVLPLPHLVQVIIQCLLRQTYLLCSSIQSVDPFAPLIDLLV